jgi:hypothetical protein
MPDAQNVQPLHPQAERHLSARKMARERLLAQAHLFEDPGTYRSGVLDAFTALDEDAEER